MTKRLAAALFLVCSGAWAQEATPAPAKPGLYQPVADAEIANFPYRRYHTTDGLGREITFYLSKPAPPAEEASRSGEAKEPAKPFDPEAPLPLVLCVQGSGSQSVFLEVDSPQGKRIASGGPEAAVLKQFRGKVRVLVVEKPGVEFLKQPKHVGGAEEGSEEFRREHTLERWVEALNAAVKAAGAVGAIKGVDSTRVLALGHSEGGQVVCHLAAKNPALTHIASMAGGGPTQLFDLIALARQGKMGLPGGTEEERVAWVVDGWAKVMEDPDAFDKFFLGHPHRRWTTFLQASAVEAALKSKAKVFLAQGAADTAVQPEATDVLYAELLARGRAVTYLRLEGADHGFMKDGKPEGWMAANKAAVEWFLAGG